MPRIAALITAAVMLAAALSAQQTTSQPAQATAQPPAATLPSQPLTFDIVSVKENKDTSPMIRLSPPVGGSFKSENTPFRMLLYVAFGVPENRIEGLPTWAESPHFDIEAKASDATPEQIKALTPAQRNAMLVDLLANRFALRTHWVTRDKSVFNLIISKSGSKLHETDPAAERRYHFLPNSFDINNMTTAALARQLANSLHRPVNDLTGLTGRYDVKLAWSPDGAPETAFSAPAAPPLFTALKETTGLELKATHGPVQVLVIDSAQLPQPN